MKRFWEPVIRPVITELAAGVLVEIGCDAGENTRNLLEFCRGRDAVLHAIDPAPRFGVKRWQAEFGSHLVFYRERSLDALPRIEAPDVVLVDGDHNWYTVFHELTTLLVGAQEHGWPFPLVMLHDVGWPYARRDLYYDPASIPERFRHPFRRAGIRPGVQVLAHEGGLNANLRNAVQESDEQNGVLTAVEDFLASADTGLSLLTVPVLNGLGILASTTHREHSQFLRDLYIDAGGTLWRRGLFAQVERERLDAEIAWQERCRVRSQDLERTRHALEQAILLGEERQRVAGAREDEAELLREKVVRLSAVEQHTDELTTQLRAARDKSSAAEAALRRVERDLETARGTLREVFRDGGFLAGWISELNTGLGMVFESRRYRVGDWMGSFYRRTRGLPRQDSAAALIERVVKRLERWRAGLAKGHRRPGLEALGAQVTASPAAVEYLLQELSHQEPVTVVIPVYNAATEVERCLESVIRHTSGDARLLVIDDASPDPSIPSLLARYERFSGVRVVRNETNLGYTRTVNRGLSESPGDVVLLNSDTEVGPRWLEGLRLAAHSDPRIGTVTAISDNAGAFSVPEIAKANPMPRHVSRAVLARAVALHSRREYPSTPTGNGFCMYIKRRLVDDVGAFDVERFPRGYGEENDLCMRALRRGFRHVVDDATFVFHARSASFGEEKRELMRRGRDALDVLYPEYGTLVKRFVMSPGMQTVRSRVADLLRDQRALESAVRRRVLFLLHAGGGGTLHTTIDLSHALAGGYDVFVLTSDGTTARLNQVDGSELVPLRRRRFDPPIAPTETSRSDYRQLVAEILEDYRIDLVHVRHLLGHTFDAPHVASAFGIPSIMSFHDFYLCCPSVHLLDERDEFCGGVCTPGPGACRIPTRWLEDLPPLKHAWVHGWRAQVRSMLAHVDALVTTSQAARDIVTNVYPELHDRDFRVIEHGRDFAEQILAAQAPVSGRPVRILVPGNIDVHKGGELLRALHALDGGRRLELHFLGRVAAEYEGLGTCHGPYSRGDFARAAADIAPAFVAVFSITAETYCHTLTEAWSAGIPALVSDHGALPERVRRHGGGWVIAHREPERAYSQILAIADDPVGYATEAARATLASIPSTRDMALQYDHLYKEVAASRRAFVESAHPGRYGTRVLRVGLIIPGRSEQHPASSHVRLLSRFRHPGLASRVAVDTISSARALAGLDLASFDVLVVQRTALPAGMAGEFVGRCLKSGTPFVFEIDDDLFHLPSHLEEAALYRRYSADLEALARGARLVTVSTEVLAKVLRHYSSNVAVVPNMLDETLWLSAERQRDDRNKTGVTAVYIGSSTHSVDLAFVRPAIERLTASRDFRLFVIGGENDSRASWYERIEVPADKRIYPSFVGWLSSLTHTWDFAIAPLVPHALNHSKSPLKYIEYSALGLPAAYSDGDPYVRLVRDGETGLLVRHDVPSWVSAMERLCDDPGLREKLREQAFADVSSHHLLGPSLDGYLDLLWSCLTNPGASARPTEQPARGH